MVCSKATVLGTHFHHFNLLSTHWRGHQTSPTVVSLKGRLPTNCNLNPLFLAKLFRYTVCFVMVLLRNRNQNLTDIENRRILFLCDGYRNANAFREGLFLLTLKGWFKLFIIFLQRMVSLMVILFGTKCFLFVYMYIDLLKL